MYCSKCGKELPNDASFCGNCGTPTVANIKPAVTTKQIKKFYNRWWFWVIIAVVAIILISASGSDNPSSDTQSSSDTIPETSSSSEDTASAEIVQISGFTNIEYQKRSPIEFTGAEIYVDSDGEEFFVLYYTWTNNTDETTSPYLKIITKVFQNGKELETCYYSVHDFNTDDDSTEVRPGIALNLHDIFYLSDYSLIEVEIQELWSDDIIASAVVNPAELD